MKTAADARPPDLTGQWIAEASKGGKPFAIHLDLEVMGDRLYGTVHYPTGDAGIQDGQIIGDRIQFRTVHTPQFADKPAEIRVDGRIKGDHLELILQDADSPARAVARRKTAAS